MGLHDNAAQWEYGTMSARRENRRTTRPPRLELLESRFAPATFTVTNANDAGVGSLRQALLDANTHTGADDVAFDTTFFATPKTIVLTGGDLLITGGTTVVGPGAANAVVSGNGVSRVFSVAISAGTAVTISGLTVTGGRTEYGGGGIGGGNGGSLSLDAVVVTGNTAGNGGGVAFFDGLLTLRNCTVSGNTATLGGGISVNDGSLLVESTTISGNIASRTGGGLMFNPGSSFFPAQHESTIRNCTISGNGALRGGGVYDDVLYGNLTLDNSTITGNTATQAAPDSRGGGGVLVRYTPGYPTAPSAVTVQSSIVSGNAATNGTADICVYQPSGPPIINVIRSAIGSPNGFTITGSNADNLPFGTDLQLGALGFNGGPTRTVNLGAASPAIGAGTNATPPLTTDQRGPGFPRQVGAAVDIGAVEFNAAAGASPAATLTAALVTAGCPTHTFTVTYADPAGVDVGALDSADVRVTGPNGYVALANYAGVTPAGNGSPRTATYTVPGPGGAFGPEDIGTYVVAVEAGQVRNVSGAAAPAGVVGTFRVAIGRTYVVANTNPSGPGSLRQALLDANATWDSADVVTFDPALFSTPRTIPLTTGGELLIAGPVTVAGPGANLLTVSGNNTVRVFNISAPGVVDVTLAGLTITGGGIGGVSCTNENVMFDGVRVTGNAGRGIAVMVDVEDSGGNLVLRRSTVAGNAGGGIYLQRGSLLLEDSTVSGNSATGGQGGGIFFSDVGPAGLTVRNSTISGNTATDGGGIAFDRLFGLARFLNSTITGNVSTTPAYGTGGIFVPFGSDGVLTLVSTIVSGNIGSITGGISDIAVASAVTVNVNFSAVGDPNGFTPSASSGNNLPFGAVLGLVPLADNGGPTKTHALSLSSLAINAGTNSAGLTTDQRGNGFLRVSGSAADIGAFEVQPSTPRVQSVVINGGAIQRSRVTELTVTFTTQVSFAGAVGDSFTLTRTGGGAVNFSATASVIGGVTVVTLTGFTGSEAQFGSLADGRYTLTALASQISAGGQALDGNGDGTPGDNFTFGEAQGLFRFFGDINGDRHVDIADFGLFSSTFNLHSSQTGFLAAFDFNGDGIIDIADFGQFSIRMFTVLP
jgi:Dockerin type I domain